MDKMNVASLFAGVGGIDIGFSQVGCFQTVYANEFDKNAQETFAKNFGDSILDRRDIHDVDPTTGVLGNSRIDTVLAGFPCQPFSVAGYRRGLDDERGDLFFEALKVIKAKQPKVVFLENVKNLVTHDHGNTFKVIREFLVHAGYYIKWKVLNAKDYGNIPQNRERIYVVGFKNKQAFDAFEFPSKIPLTTSLTKVIDFSAKVNEKYYYRKNKQPFYDELAKYVTSSDTIYQWRRQYVRENKSHVIPTLTANMGTGGHNVPLIKTFDGQIRKLTPRETFNAQGYPSKYKLPESLSNSALYKEAGNSVVIPVIKRIATNIAKAIELQPQDSKLPNTKDKTALIYTCMKGRMEGTSYPIGFFSSDDELKKFVEEKTDQRDRNFPVVPVFDNDMFFQAIKKGGDHKFFTKVG